MQGNTISEFELSQVLAESKIEALFIADPWVLKRIWMMGILSHPILFKWTPNSDNLMWQIS